MTLYVLQFFKEYGLRRLSVRGRIRTNINSLTYSPQIQIQIIHKQQTKEPENTTSAYITTFLLEEKINKQDLFLYHSQVFSPER